MPIYEYRCGACGHRMEQLQRMSDAPLTDCPQCGRSALVKMVTAAGFQLKGGGWYVTDFKNGGKSPSAAGAGKSAADGGSAGKPAADGGAKGGGAKSEAAACGAGACPACN
jgi:putative FmdB family regulatory protein